MTTGSTGGARLWLSENTAVTAFPCQLRGSGALMRGTWFGRAYLPPRSGNGRSRNCARRRALGSLQKSGSGTPAWPRAQRPCGGSFTIAIFPRRFVSGYCTLRWMRGTVMQTSNPSGLLRKASVPACVSMTDWTTVRPRPVPPVVRPLEASAR